MTRSLLPAALPPQFVTLYTRTGHKVLVNKMGDMIGEWVLVGMRLTMGNKMSE